MRYISIELILYIVFCHLTWYQSQVLSIKKNIVATVRTVANNDTVEAPAVGNPNNLPPLLPIYALTGIVARKNGDFTETTLASS